MYTLIPWITYTRNDTSATTLIFFKLGWRNLNPRKNVWFKARCVKPLRHTPLPQPTGLEPVHRSGRILLISNQPSYQLDIMVAILERSAVCISERSITDQTAKFKVIRRNIKGFWTTGYPFYRNIRSDLNAIL